MDNKVAKAIGMLRGVSYGASQCIAEGIIDAVEMLEDALEPAPEINIPLFAHTRCKFCKHGIYEENEKCVYCQKLADGISIEMPPNGYCYYAERESRD